MFQLYELNDDPKRKEFLDDLFSFMQKKGKWKDEKNWHKKNFYLARLRNWKRLQWMIQFLSKVQINEISDKSAVNTYNLAQLRSCRDTCLSRWRDDALPHSRITTWHRLCDGLAFAQVRQPITRRITPVNSIFLYFFFVHIYL